MKEKKKKKKKEERKNKYKRCQFLISLLFVSLPSLARTLCQRVCSFPRFAKAKPKKSQLSC